MRSVELFAGLGGLALGLARAGFEHDLVVECDADCIRTLEDNRLRKVEHVRKWSIEQRDARDLDFRRFEAADLLSGGPPCQPFSIGGNHLGPRDARNMWPVAVRAVREIRPTAFIFENVRGLFRPDFAPYLEYITLQLTYPSIARRKGERWPSHLRRLRDKSKSGAGKSAEYRVVSRAINTADYGAAQKRHRAIFLGVAAEFGDDWAFPEQTHSQEALAWTKHVTGSYWRRFEARRVVEPASPSEARALEAVRAGKKKPKTLPWRTVRDAIFDLPAPLMREDVQGHWQHAGARTYPNHTGSSFDEPAKALKAGDHGVPGGENMLANSWGNVRYFTVREMARLQDLPDDFHVQGSWKAATRQLGNALPVSVGKQMGDAIAAVLRKRKSPKASPVR